MARPAPSPRDPERVARFVERLAAGLVDAGMARMPARVLVALLATDSGRLTSAQLGEVLRVSPAAVSGAIRYLEQANMVVREPGAGSRRERYVVSDDVWYEHGVRREQRFARWETSVREGMEALGPDTPAGRRMAETLAYLEFVEEELASLRRRWCRRRAELGFGP